MKNISIGKYRALQQCSSSTGSFTILALDHRQNLRKANPVFTSDIQLSQFKQDVTSALARYATAVLLDPEVSAAQVIANGILPGEKGLLVALEATGYGGYEKARKARLIPGWSVKKAKMMGASMVKLLVYYHPKSETSLEIEDLVTTVAGECQEFDIGLMLELLTYSLRDSNLEGEEKRDIVVESAGRLTHIPGVDILKAELPYDPKEQDTGKIASACSSLSQASLVPWILLSGAVPFEVFAKHTEIACASGSSGIAVGRAVWQEAVSMPVEQRLTFLHDLPILRMEKLHAVCNSLAKPWTKFYSSEADMNWYKTYSTFD